MYAVKHKLILLLFIAGAFFMMSPKAIEKNADGLLKEMFAAIDDIRTLRYDLTIVERIKGQVRRAKSKVKLQRYPRKMYIDLNGPELLWVQGQNNGMALVNPNAFPYFNLNLEPQGSILREGQHHSIHDVGFDYFASILKTEIKKVGGNFDQVYIYTGDDRLNGRACYKVTVNHKGFGYVDYTVKPKENLFNIAKKLSVNEYMILENNPKLKDYTSVTAGSVIKVPTYYAKFILIYIDKETKLPIGSHVFDDKGLYESYEYENVVVNSNIDPKEFTKYFKGYRF